MFLFSLISQFIFNISFYLRKHLNEELDSTFFTLAKNIYFISCILRMMTMWNVFVRSLDSVKILRLMIDIINIILKVEKFE